MNNIIARKIDLTDQFQQLSESKTVGTVTVTALSGNSSEVILLGDTGDQVPLVPGEWHTFIRVDLARINVKGSAGDGVTVVGGTW
ncbi:hypothetical protein STSP2_01095 [Anaerohalosphaera lusitana]|uniref:Uncharacterized protein n=1 Tax=Anaerohalosphaera lusitana TaxID=1936003 RepID=A0A1U9NJ32_9BACT|nr:hypothetical protein [Anaerohalosphaera lusitana]AQT67943.1 hypothetical protein STSP2_01095 [Anaerohalosphaera lusitana]